MTTRGALSPFPLLPKPVCPTLLRYLSLLDIGNFVKLHLWLEPSRCPIVHRAVNAYLDFYKPVITFWRDDDSAYGKIYDLDYFPRPPCKHVTNESTARTVFRFAPTKEEPIQFSASMGDEDGDVEVETNWFLHFILWDTEPVWELEDFIDNRDGITYWHNETIWHEIHLECPQIKEVTRYPSNNGEAVVGFRALKLVYSKAWGAEEEDEEWEADDVYNDDWPTAVDGEITGVLVSLSWLVSAMKQGKSVYNVKEGSDSLGGQDSEEDGVGSSDDEDSKWVTGDGNDEGFTDDWYSEINEAD
ncbi:hypothetical protein HDV00_006592 [Rhizophlyctis rosea]|nr:hypothetical protein HDV00_006592 [Rhizophlyctis rosea]